MKKRILSMLLIMTFTMVFFSGCGSSTKDQASSEKEKFKVGIAFSWVGMNAFMSKISTDLKEAVENDPNMELVFFDAKMDPVVQAGQFDDLINKDVDVILSAAVDGATLVPSVKKAKDAGIPVIMFISVVPEEGFQYLAMDGSYDEYGENGEGIIGAQQLAAAIDGKGKVVEITGDPSTQVALVRSKAFQKELSKYTDIELVDTQNGAWIKANAQTIAENMINKYSDLAGIYCASGEMAEGVLEAIKSAGLTGKIKVASSSSTPGSYDAIKAGELVNSTYENPSELAVHVFELTKKVQNGESYEFDQRLDSFAVTKENIDEVERPEY